MSLVVARIENSRKCKEMIGFDRFFEKSLGGYLVRELKRMLA